MTKIKCPECGNTEQFDICFSSIGSFCWDEGQEAYTLLDDFGDIEFEGDSPCYCNDCGHDGILVDFEED